MNRNRETLLRVRVDINIQELNDSFVASSAISPLPPGGLAQGHCGFTLGLAERVCGGGAPMACSFPPRCSSPVLVLLLDDNTASIGSEARPGSGIRLEKRAIG